jgi:tetratricopeptide (TPR) repeat protein
MTMEIPSFERMDRNRLHGRDQLLAALMEKIDGGCTTLGIDGVTGIGKTAVIDRLSLALQDDRDFHVVRLDAALESTEPLLVSGLYRQLRDVPKSTDQEIEAALAKMRKIGASQVRKVVGAMVQDVLKLATTKAEKTIEALGEIVAGDESAAATELETLDEPNRRAAIGEFMRLVADLGNRVVVVVDNYERGDSSAQQFMRFLIETRPSSWSVIVAANTEKEPPSDWNKNLAPTIEAEAGSVVTLPGLETAAIREWFVEEIGREPERDELAELIERSAGGRPEWLRRLLEEIRTGVTGPLPSVAALHASRRADLDGTARAIAELLAVVPAEHAVPLGFLEAAASLAKIDSFGAAIDSLLVADQISISAGAVRFRHSSLRETWRGTYGDVVYNKWLGIWYEAFRLAGYESRLLSSSGLVQPLTTLLVEHRPVDLGGLAGQLLQHGAQEDALALLDGASRDVQGGSAGGQDVIETALIAAQVRMDLGRYSEVQQDLRIIETARPDSSIQRRADLISMKLALRLNTYEAVWALSKKLKTGLDYDQEAERELIVNTALRDLLDLEAIATSVERLRQLADHAPSKKPEILRATARSYAKIGRAEDARKAATDALELAEESGDVRAMGNAHLALAEALRHAGDRENAVDHYRKGAILAKSYGNRDSLLWCRLGEACAWLEANDFAQMDTALAEVRRIVDEPGFEHPLEGAHASLIAAVAAIVQDRESNAEPALEQYAELGVGWPRVFFDGIKAGRPLTPIPI